MIALVVVILPLYPQDAFALLLGTKTFLALVLSKWLLIAVEKTLVQKEYISITL